MLLFISFAFVKFKFLLFKTYFYLRIHLDFHAYIKNLKYTENKQYLTYTLHNGLQKHNLHFTLHGKNTTHFSSFPLNQQRQLTHFVVVIRRRYLQRRR